MVDIFAARAGKSLSLGFKCPELGRKWLDDYLKSTFRTDASDVIRETYFYGYCDLGILLLSAILNRR